VQKNVVALIYYKGNKETLIQLKRGSILDKTLNIKETGLKMLTECKEKDLLIN
jgi:hypothetical protein